MECQLSSGVWFTAAAIESTFLMLEHEYICGTEQSSFMCDMLQLIRRAAAATVEPAETEAPLPPTPPNPVVLSRCYTRCGMNQRMPLRAALDAALKPLLRKYKGLLPRAGWRAICMEIMQSLQAVADALQEVPNPPLVDPPKPPPVQRSVASMHVAGVGTDGSAAEGSNSAMHAEHAHEDSQEMGWVDFQAGCIATNRLVCCASYDALQERSEEVCSDEHACATTSISCRLTALPRVCTMFFHCTTSRQWCIALCTVLAIVRFLLVP